MRSSTMTVLAVWAVAVLATSAGVFAKDPDKLKTLALAQQVDKLVVEGLTEHNQQPNPPVSDEVFLRRAYLDIAGRIPTLEEAQRFLSSKDITRRSQLIDELLDSEGYVSNYYNYWADILRARSRFETAKVDGEPYMAWIKQSLRDNTPYDKFVYQMLDSEGAIYENGAAGYYLRDSGMPLDNLSNTVRIFLGTQVGCAQCHDHPFDKWTQREFYEMAAFTYGVQTRSKPDFQKMREVRNLAEKQLDANQQARLRNILRPLTYSVHEDARRKLHLPDDYKYDDAKPGSTVEPATIFGASIKLEGNTSPQDAFAAWVTSKDNPRFALTIANRLWAKVMGIGVMPAVDDIKDDSPNVNPKLMDFLTQQMVAVNFDMKAYLRILYNTRTYQSQASREELKLDEPYYFPGPALRRMTAEQVWDSLLTLKVDNVDTRVGPASFAGRSAGVAMMATMTPQQLVDIGKDPQKMRTMVMTNSDVREQMKQRFKQGRGGVDMVRASELTSPAPAGHFLRTFGQSDREQVQAASVEPSITQALTMLNGPIDKEITRSDSLLVTNFKKAATDQERMHVIWLSILGREPSSSEAAAAMQCIKSEGQSDGYTDIVWALLNTREFIFVQ